MNTYVKYCPNVFVAKCDEKHEKGEIIKVTTKHGKENECVVYNLVLERGGYYYYSIVRADGYNLQEIARRKSEKYYQSAINAMKRSEEYFEKSQRHSEFLQLGEPIKVGHHSEARHRKVIENAWRNTGKMVEQQKKAEEYNEKAEYFSKRLNDINLSMPESIEFYKKKLEEAERNHDGMKNGSIERAHSYSLTYAKKAVNEAKKNYEIALILWG